MRKRLVFIALVLSSVLGASAEDASATESYALRRHKAFQLVDEKSPEAAPRLKALLKEKPDDHELLFRLGVDAMRSAYQLEPGAARKKAFKEVRGWFEKAKQAGSTDPLVDHVLTAVKQDGTEIKGPLADRPDLDKALRAAETAFQQQNFTEAISHYQAALKIDPANYMATLHLGDSWFAMGKYEAANDWFRQAAKIDPNRETAHRYLGDSFSKLRRRDDALDHYLEAVIAEPYNGYPWRALKAGCEAFLLKPWIAAQDAPTAEVKNGDKGAEIILPQKFSVMNLAYATARAKWQEENRAKWSAGGQAHRHSLDEEVAALRATVKMYAEMRIAKDAPPDLAKSVAESGPAMDQLAEIDAAGLLEPHVLFFRANAGIAADYAAYREKNREKLHAYLLKYYLRVQ